MASKGRQVPKLLAVITLSLVGGCHLVFPHTPAPRSRDASRDLAAVDAPPVDAPPREATSGADLAPGDLTPDRSPDLRKPDLAPAQGKTCQNPTKTAWFSASAPPTPGATLTLTACVKNASSTTWIMAGVKKNLSDGKGTCCTGCYVGQVQTVSCSGYSNGWKIDGIKVPTGPGPFAFSLLADCVGDSCTAGKELAWCQP